ncbi:polyphosphate kinase 1 [Rurimicrobium arvi]|uniref:Polyphosphate kinase n=1 Tax=Rurimicrobium arvi TaxID=2049916 RepID=A0ABP8MGC5_9BACT
MKKIKEPIVRDLSWLAFNERVLQEAKDPTVSVYERLRFLGIFSNNLDEFFRVRVATLNKMVRLGKAAKVHLEANPEGILRQIQQTVILQQNDFDNTYQQIIRELAQQQIFIKNEQQLSLQQEDFIRKYYTDKVSSQIVPLMIESIPQMPLLRDKSIYLACVLGNKGNRKLRRYALIEIPTKVLPRFIIIPSEEHTTDIILLEDIIRFNLGALFAPFGFDEFSGYIIKVTRDAELEADNDVQTSLIEKLEKQIKDRKKGKTTRFVFDRNLDLGLLDFLSKRLGLTKKDNLIPGGRIHNFKDFMDFPASVFSNLPTRPKPFTHPQLKQPLRIMQLLDHQDVMLHFPYHSFDSVIEFLREAAIDPFVQSIKITCYRLAKESKVVNALVNAVRNGKQVTVMLELRARFDEEANLTWKAILEEEGVKVILGVPDMKVHAKLCVIKRRETNNTKYYGFVSTGNLNESTAAYYGDHCLLTSNRSILADINKVFNCLEKPKVNLAELRTCKTLPVAPVTMRSYFMALIDKEIELAKKKKPASLIVKLNSLVDKPLVEKLQQAAIAGVEVNLIIRSICCLITQHKTYKKNIKAISIIDEYLEHARVFVFNNGGKPKVFISSADWMVRNLDHRVEAACPVTDPKLQKELIEILKIQLAGNIKTRILDNNQDNLYVASEENEPLIRSQEETYRYLFNKSNN